MDYIDSKFDKVFADKGGIHISTPEFSRVISIKDISQKIRNASIISHPNFPIINGDFIQSSSLNACVRKYDNQYYLGFYVGGFFLINDLFRRMFSTKSILPDIGDINEETDKKTILNAIVDNGVVSFDMSNPTNTGEVKNKIRNEFANFYMSFAVNFLMYHEFGHVLHGHVDYYYNASKNKSWIELAYNDESTKIDSLISQTLEMDADSFAVNYSYNLAVLTIDNYDNLPVAHKIIYKDIGTFLSHWVFAIYSFFKLCRFGVFNEKNARNLSHPPPSIRMSMIMSNLIIIMKNKGIENYLEISDQMQNSILKAEEAFTEVTYNKNEIDIFYKNHFASTQYVHDIAKNWNDVYPLISPYSHVELPPMV